MEDECSWVVGLRVTWINREVGLAGTWNSREVSLWDTIIFTEVGLAQPHFQREVGLGNHNFSTIQATCQRGRHARQLCREFQRGRHYDYLREPSKDVIRMRHVNILRCFNIDSSLIIALVERWKPETHTFHLPHGECTITLEDVSLQLEVNVNGLPIVGPTYFDWNEICEELLGKVPGDEQDMRGCELKLTWLFDNFETLPLALHSCKRSNFVGHKYYT
ncbi:hypothetical protein Lal_00004764 [Lupinus albus]|nr:hypothetical protein Lal_00004764 [Lupinus albus]